MGCLCLCLHRARGTSFLIHGALLLATALLDDSQDQGRRIVAAFSKCLADSRLHVLGRVDQVLNHDSLYYSIFVYTTRYSWILSKHLGLGGKVRSIKGQGIEWGRVVVGRFSAPVKAKQMAYLNFFFLFVFSQDQLGLLLYPHDVSYSWLARNISFLCRCFKATPRCQLRPSNIFGFRNESLHW